MTQDPSVRKKNYIQDMNFDKCDIGVDSRNNDLDAQRLNISNSRVGFQHRNGNLNASHFNITDCHIGMRLGGDSVTDFINELEMRLNTSQRQAIQNEIKRLRVEKEPSKMKEIVIGILTWIGTNVGRPVADELGKRAAELIPKW